MPAAALRFVWPHVRAMIAASLSQDHPRLYRLEDVLASLVKEESRLWVAGVADADGGSRILGAAVTFPLQYPLCRTVKVWVAGGDALARWWDPMDAAITAVAKEHGCAYLEYVGRGGWTRRGTWHDLGAARFREL